MLSQLFGSEYFRLAWLVGVEQAEARLGGGWGTAIEGAAWGAARAPPSSLPVEGDARMDDSTGDAITEAGAPVDTVAGRAAPIAQAAEAVTPVTLPTAPRNPAISPAG